MPVDFSKDIFDLMEMFNNSVEFGRLIVAAGKAYIKWFRNGIRDFLKKSNFFSFKNILKSNVHFYTKYDIS